MARGLEKYFGSVPDMDLEAQRGIVTLSRPKEIGWREIDTLIARRSFTLAYIHLRARGQFIEAVCASCKSNRVFFEVAGSGQRIELKDQEEGRRHLHENREIAGRVEEWKAGPEPLLTLLGGP